MENNLNQEQFNQEQFNNEELNTNFVQIYRDHFAEIRWLMDKNVLACKIFLFILEHMDRKNALACSSAILEDYFDKSRSTISRAIKILKDSGFIHILKMGNCNVYVVNQEIAWTDKGNLKKYCKFEGNMLVSHKENKDYAYTNSYNKPKVLSNPNLKKEGEF